MTDPIADMLTRIRNAYLVKKPEVVLPYSKFKHNLATMLQNHGWLMSGEPVEEQGVRRLRLTLKYDESGQPAVSGVMRVSKPGQRIYLQHHQLSRLGSHIGVAIVSTSRGLMTDRQAREKKIGGEIICQIW